MEKEVIAACIAGAVAWLVAVLAKEQKTSEFRQAWIDSLRAELADFVAIKLHVCMLANAKGPAEAAKFVESQIVELTRAQTNFERVRLRLNPEERANKKLLAKLQEWNDVLPGVSGSNVSGLADDITTLAQPVLKREWKRVKRGEWIFVITEVIAAATVISALGYAGGRLLGLWP